MTGSRLIGLLVAVVVIMISNNVRALRGVRWNRLNGLSGGGKRSLSSQHMRSMAESSPRVRRGMIATLALATCAAASARQFSTTGLSMMAAHCHGAEGGVVAASETPKETFRKDYMPSDYTVPDINMFFDLAAAKTTVTTTSTVVPAKAGADLVLDGEDCIKLVSLEVDGQKLSDSQYKIEKDTLRIFGSALPTNKFSLVSKVEISPKENLALSGLYASGEKLLCTQCEAEGFRRITYHLDRPDILSKYTVRLESDKAQYPQLLSNGNMVDSGDMDGGRHYTVWEDPFPKPSYLFAVVGGDLGSVHDSYTTKSGRKVALGIYSEKEDAHKLDHAMYSIKESMKWDEEKFDLECDLDVYNIVATSDFNMGAMENKGLNIFNSAYVLANSATATDADYENILGVIGHEYFHNWTGNRVTLRDWFQLTLKEGLTVFRDQWFSSDMTGEAVKRIGDVRVLRARQFPEDSGPMAHPVRPESYISMDNFYTSTVYNKGAEVVRMYRTILGDAGFKKGMKLYFERHDGGAATCDDFRAAMADANGADLSQFERWYTQAGTPTVSVKYAYDEAGKKLSLTLKQTALDTPGQKAAEKEPWHIPVTIGLLSAASGKEILPSQVLQFTQGEQTFEFNDVQEKPVLSLFRGFSAPVKVSYVDGQSDAELAFLMAHDTDTFNRWDAGDRLSTNVIMSLTELDSVASIEAAELSADFVDAIRTSLNNAASTDAALLSAALTLPDLGTLSQLMDVVEVDKLVAATKRVKRVLGGTLKAEFEAVYAATTTTGAYEFNSKETGRRRLRNTCLDYICAEGGAAAAIVAKAHYDSANCMTDRLTAFRVLCGQKDGTPEKEEVIKDFYAFANNDALVLNKWFAVQATVDTPGAIDRVKALKEHPDFSISNPNRCRSLISMFAANNMAHFHAADGSGYKWVADAVVELDKLNPQVAARMAGAFSQWKRYDAGRKELMREQLEMIQKAEGLSKDTYEVATRCLK